MVTTCLDRQHCFLTEWYQPRLKTSDLEDLTSALERTARGMSADGEPIELIITVAAAGDEILYGLFTSDTAETVAHTCRQAGLPADRISAVDARLAAGREL
ncbi:hypothetical protein AU184_16515 [Mycolicibacterium novocastrense]|nr:hypothetical protein AU183_18770 [Mycolicibacterium novocastrense]KUH68218.1 hypothetical protein AU072_21235 [Mycolicibacterium novocastrense]KUH68631.1 hypothetical protein AU184_16515 [Mycolicibacterium novocastrense]